MEISVAPEIDRNEVVLPGNVVTWQYDAFGNTTGQPLGDSIDIMVQDGHGGIGFVKETFELFPEV